MSSQEEVGEPPPSPLRPDEGLEQWRNNPENMQAMFREFGDERRPGSPSRRPQGRPAREDEGMEEEEEEDSPHAGASSAQAAAHRSTGGSAPQVESRPSLFPALASLPGPGIPALPLPCPVSIALLRGVGPC